MLTDYHQLDAALDAGLASYSLYAGLGLFVSMVALRLVCGFWQDRMHIVLLAPALRSEEHTSELQSLMRLSYAAFFLKKKKTKKSTQKHSKLMHTYHHITSLK